jgi:hypothetical protein
MSGRAEAKLQVAQSLVAIGPFKSLTIGAGMMSLLVRVLFIWFALRLRWLRGKDLKGVRVCPLSHTLRVLHFHVGRLRVSAKASRGEFKLAPVVKSHGDFNLRSS